MRYGPGIEIMIFASVLDRQILLTKGVVRSTWDEDSHVDDKGHEWGGVTISTTYDEMAEVITELTKTEVLDNLGDVNRLEDETDKRRIPQHADQLPDDMLERLTTVTGKDLDETTSIVEEVLAELAGLTDA